MIATIEPQETELLFFDCPEVTDRPWWQGPGGSIFERQEGNAAPPGRWSYRVHIENPDTGLPGIRILTHSRIFAALLDIDSGDDTYGKDLSPDPEVTQNVRAYLHDPDPNHLDPHTIDQVLQVAVYGGVIHR